MKPRDRKLALKALRLWKRGNDEPAIARRLKLDLEAALVVRNRGVMIAKAEGYRLTDDEMDVMVALARVEARAVALGAPLVKVNQVDFAAGKKSGWCARVAKKRLRKARFVEEDDVQRLNLLAISDNRNIWLTPSGWAFVWATGLILKNWRVPQ